MSTELEIYLTIISVVSFLPYVVYFKGCNSKDIQYRKLKKYIYLRLTWTNKCTQFERNQTIFTAVMATCVKIIFKGNNSEEGKLIKKTKTDNLDDLLIHLRAKFRWNWLVNYWENEGFVFCHIWCFSRAITLEIFNAGNWKIVGTVAWREQNNIQNLKEIKLFLRQL